MALKNILVQLDQTPRSFDRFDLALKIAQQHQADLTGFYSTASTYFAQGLDKQKSMEVRKTCIDKTAAAKVQFHWSETEEGQEKEPLTKRITQQAFFSDLVVIGQPDSESNSTRDLPEQLVLTTGRPVLTVPFAGNFTTVGKRILVAWKAGRASARALSDTLPFLLQADEVILISFSTTTAERDENSLSLSKARSYLGQHGIKIRTEQQMLIGIGPGDALLNMTADEGIDLLVTGGAAPSQFNPIADHLLKQMTVPVLMAS